MSAKLWTSDDLAALRDQYPRMRTAVLVTQLGRSERAIYMQAALLGIKKSAEYLASPEACRLRRGGDIGKALSAQIKTSNPRCNPATTQE